MDSNSELARGAESTQEQPFLLEGRDEKEVAEQVGRINDLPDDIIANILSFLETDEAIRTCILCSRWRYLWRGITSICLVGNNLDFDRFSNLVEHVLRNCSSTDFQAFKLYCPKIIDVPRLSTLLSCILSRKIEELILLAYCERSCVPLEELKPPLPQYILSCSTLVALKLDYFDIQIPESLVGFPLLKSLSVGVIFSNRDGVHRLLSCCPVLEELYLFGILDGPEVLEIDISVPTLRKLNTWLQNYNCLFGHRSIITINTPNLNHLLIEDSTYYAEYVMKDIACLHYVEVGFGGDWYDKNDLLGFLKGIKTTKILRLDFFTLHALWIALSYTWPTFLHMKTLVLESVMFFGWTCLPKLLHSAPNLKVLVLDLERSNEDNDDSSYKWSPPDSVPTCLLEHLEVIGIQWSHENEVTLQVIEYFLHNAQVLERMMIGSTTNFEKVLEKTLMFPRASKTCDVQIYQRLHFQRLISLLTDLPTPTRGWSEW